MNFRKINLKSLESSYENPLNLMFKKIRIIQHFIKNKDSLLDLGVGTGAFIDLIKNRIKFIYGLDLDEDSIEICLRKFSNNRNIHIQYGNIIEIEKIFQGMKFDYITALDVLEHMDEKTAKNVLNLIYNLLKDNGKFIFSGPGIFEKLKIFLSNSYSHLFSHSSYGWMKMINKAGFKINHIETVQFPFVRSEFLRKNFHLFGKCCIILAQK